MIQASKLKSTCLAVVAAGLVSLSAGSAAAAGKGSMHVAFGDIPGADMLNFMAEYSVWYPVTSSASASGRSNGTR